MRLAVGFVLVLLAMAMFERGIIPAQGSGVIYIRSDGSVFPSSAPISTSDNLTYRLTDNVHDEIVVQRSNIAVDGAGFVVQGTGGGYGLTLNSVNGVVMRNTTVKGFADGIWLYGSFNVSIVGNSITENRFTAVSLYSSSNNSISENSMTGGRYGLFLVSSSGNIVRHNNLTGTEVSGISLESYSNNNNVTANLFTNSGMLISYSIGNVAEGNQVNKKPLVLLDNVSNKEVTDAGQVILINCTNVQIENLDIDHTAVGLELWDTANTRISNNRIENCYYGIWLSRSSNVSVVGNTITGNSYGVELWRSSQNVFIHNNLVNNTHPVHDYAWDDPELVLSTNNWDSGYAAEGNYWSDYHGTDSNGDGIGDTQYTIDANNTDRYPLMSVYWSPCDINYDLKVDMKDVGKSARAFNTRLGDALWDPHADITGPEPLVLDGKVDMRDISLIARHWGEHY